MLLGLQRALSSAGRAQLARLQEVGSGLSTPAAEIEISELEISLEGLHKSVAILDLAVSAGARPPSRPLRHAHPEGESIDATQASAVKATGDAAAAAAALAARCAKDRRLLAEFGLESIALRQEAARCAALLQPLQAQLAGYESQGAEVAREAMAELAERVHAEARRVQQLARAADLAGRAHAAADALTTSRLQLEEILTRQLVERAQQLLRQWRQLRQETDVEAREMARVDLVRSREDLLMWLAQGSAACMRIQMNEHELSHSLARFVAAARRCA